MALMPPTPRLETARLRLEPISMVDAPAVQRRFPQWEIVRHLGARVPWPYPRDGAERYLRTLLDAMEAGRKNAWSLRLEGGPQELIGIIELWPPDPSTRDSRGFWIAPEFQRRGLMTEAADRVVDYAFEELGWPFLWLGNAKSNIACARVKEHQGAVLIDEVPFVFVGGQEPRQVWLLEAEAWKKRSEERTS